MAITFPYSGGFRKFRIFQYLKIVSYYLTTIHLLHYLKLRNIERGSMRPTQVHFNKPRKRQMF